MRGLPSILSLFRNKFNKFSNTGARMLDSIYHMTKTTFKSCFLCENSAKILPYTGDVIMDVITQSGLSILMHGVISLSDATSYDKTFYPIILKVFKKFYWTLTSGSNLLPPCLKTSCGSATSSMTAPMIVL